MQFKITYTEGDVSDMTVEIEAGCRQKAMLLFWVDHPEASDVSKVEKVEPEEDD